MIPLSVADDVLISRVAKFHFGGSTHCLLFRKGVNVKGFPEPGRKENVPVRGELARVMPRERA